MTVEQLQALARSGEMVEVTITVKAKVVVVHSYITPGGDHSWAALQLECESRLYLEDDEDRLVSIDLDEIMEIQPCALIEADDRDRPMKREGGKR